MKLYKTCRFRMRTPYSGKDKMVDGRVLRLLLHDAAKILGEIESAKLPVIITIDSYDDNSIEWASFITHSSIDQGGEG